MNVWFLARRQCWLMARGCPLCRKADWEAKAPWIETTSVEWRRLGEASFDSGGQGRLRNYKIIIMWTP